MTNRVVITGLGALTPLGIGKEAYWQNLLNGVSGVKPLEFPDIDINQYRTRIAATLDSFDPAEYIPQNKRTKYLGRTSQAAMAAAKLALEDAGFSLLNEKTHTPIDGIDPYRVGVILGSASGSMEIMEQGHKELLKVGGPKRISPHALPHQLISAIPANVAIQYNCRGTSYAVPTACSSASQAIGNSYRLLQTGGEDMIITGGADCCITPLVFGSFVALKGMSTRNDDPQAASRPFDRDRDGFVMGEGAGIVILEKLDHALARNAPIYAEIVGFGMTSDAYHITVPDLKGTSFVRAIQMAMEEAGIQPEAIDYINAHGTSTRLNDPIETQAIKTALGKRAYEIPVNSTKSMTGHLMGAAGGVETIATAMTLRDGMVHPTINYQNPDPECDLDYVPNEKRSLPVRTAMSNSLGFGGFNSVLIMRKYED